MLPFRARWAWLLFIGILALGFYRLRLDVDMLNLLPSDLEAVEGLKVYQKKFSNSRELIVALEGPNSEATTAGAQKFAEYLRARPELVSRVFWQPPWLERPAEASEMLAYLWQNQSPADIASLVDRLQPEKLPAVLADTKERLANSFSPMDIGKLSYDPFGLTQFPESSTAGFSTFGSGQELFASEDGKLHLIFITAATSLQDFKVCQKWIREMRQAVAAFQKEQGMEGLQFHFTGAPAFAAEISSGMEKDTTLSVIGTAVFISILFFIAHRRIKPMLWLLVLLLVILLTTLALGALLFQSVNVISLGFAAILLGLAVDYAVVHYQEALAHPGLPISKVRSAIAPSISWAALTTISAFLILNLGGLPGLGQLGTLVALGVGVSALVMIFFFLPPLFRDRPKFVSGGDVHKEGESRETWIQTPWLYFVVGLLVVVPSSILSRGVPPFDKTANALRPRNSEPYQTLDLMKAKIMKQQDPVWVVFEGNDVEAIRQRVEKADKVLARAKEKGEIASYMMPQSFLPTAGNVETNRALLNKLVQQQIQLNSEAVKSGFTTNSMVLANTLLDSWRKSSANPGWFPTNAVSQWAMGNFLLLGEPTKYVLGMIYPNKGDHAPEIIGSSWFKDLSREQSSVSSWELLGYSIFQRVQSHFYRVAVPMCLLVLLVLWVGFRSWLEMALSLGIMLLSFLCLLSVMRIMGWSWNLMNMMAIPLLLGTGVDYSIFMQLALRRHRGNLKVAHQSVGKALLLCGGTAVIGFGSLTWSINSGMASLGKVCAIGIGFNMIFAIYLLPSIWKALRVGKKA
ncbi:MAG: putative rane protein [Verrucomicrobiales bacterium]|nr:putative rane protein [Verrucomicrobiales bacterium]